ncbi:protein of unknown function [Pseudobutyrivibrio sp. UC1225]|uniref:DUF362 domain-containing protein n=1 Tax=Pseudobutyrivibrio sp. UC1225 TaxID=1798185 RepID=UPI0008EF9683|nr:DUF362 domain-containing protein [Pseudobutyrivibrio sp. UC1225]SFN78743.1 protein of unknown function [Pseudobutyrivibrio sp. UC1225]
MNIDVAIYKTDKACYPTKNSLFRPSRRYPEYIFNDISNEENNVYDSVREAIHLFGYDKENYGKKEWNPFGNIINEHTSVLIKPNLVMDLNRTGEGTECLYTQPSVIAPVIDYVIKAQNGKGIIVVGDAPMQECRFDRLIEESGLEELINYYKSKGINISLVDFREVKSEIVMGSHKQTVEDKQSGTIINLDENSEFYNCDEKLLKKLRITNYDPRGLAAHHNGEKHEYYVSNYLLDADVVINMPKPKTHRKAGVTIAMKNMVGINSRKEFLPHHTVGSVSSGGDEYKKKSLLRIFSDNLYDYKNMKEAEGKYLLARPAFCFAYGFKILANLIHNEPGEGSWSGNHTISRTITDLNKIIVYADKNGKLCKSPQRKMIIIADMIIAGEKEGPVLPSPKKLGVIAVGENQVAFDIAIATLMGADVKKIPTIQNASSVEEFNFGKLDNPRIISNRIEYSGLLSNIDKSSFWNFVPTSGWTEVFIKG